MPELVRGVFERALKGLRRSAPKGCLKNRLQQNLLTKLQNAATGYTGYSPLLKAHGWKSKIPVLSDKIPESRDRLQP
jgi:hypothetical protein